MAGKPQDSVGAEGDETAFTDHLLEQFAAFYVLSVLAVKALEKARQHHALRTKSARSS